MSSPKTCHLKPLVLLVLLCLQLGKPAAQPKQESKTNDINIDFSVAGYKGGEALPPTVPAVLFVRPSGGDDTRLLQGALDAIGKLPLQKNGFRGALQLVEGRYRVSGQLVFSNSGIVMRGSRAAGETVIEATGNSRRTLVEVGTVDSVSPANALQITSDFVPAGSRMIKLEHTKGLQIGDRVVITRPCTAKWISDIGMNKDEGMFAEHRGLRWPVGSRTLRWDRTIKAINNVTREVTLDAPVTTAIEKLYGGATIRKLPVNALVRNIGIERITVQSEFDHRNRADEEHAWIGIHINYSEDTWIRDVSAWHFVGSAIRVGPRARRVTIMNCSSQEPVSEIGGYRRYSFLVEGQQVLVRDCTADSAINAFASGYCAAGPNVFLNCLATHALGASGSFESWASGLLYENVRIEDGDLRLTHDVEQTQAGGWTAANSVLWNCTAQKMEALGPASAPNQIFYAGISLYEKQLIKRLGRKFVGWYFKDDETGLTTQETLWEFTENDIPPILPIYNTGKTALTLVNGRFVMGSKAIWGGTIGDNFWRGQAFPAGELNSGICLTRWVPGRVGPGLTEDLSRLAGRMVSQGNIFYQSLTGLWYDRRRDDHSIFQRKDGMVWAPFLEMPWRRTGTGKAWDGLSLFDLTNFNPWYFGRLKEFATLCEENGLVLYHSLYDTHNLLEYLTHWVDYPFREVNNVNRTGLQEPDTISAWARFHGANQFYNASDSTLRRLHRAYIFHVLDELGFASNLLFNLASEFSGPLEFQRFFLQTVQEWEEKRQHRVRLVLNTTKDITDSILADPELAKRISVIDTRYWQYRPAGTFAGRDSVWAPPGGANRSFREMVGEAFILQSGIPFPTQQEQMYRQVREYTDKYPDKAVVSVSNDVSPIPSLMAGGAQVIMGSQKDGWEGRTTFDSFVKTYLANMLMHMKPKDGVVENSKMNWCLLNENRQSLLVYSLSGEKIVLLNNISDAAFDGVWFDPLSEKVYPFEGVASLNKGTIIRKPSRLNWLLLLQVKQGH